MSREGLLEEVALGLGLDDGVSVCRDAFELESLFWGHCVEIASMAPDGRHWGLPS